MQSKVHGLSYDKHDFLENDYDDKRNVQTIKINDKINIFHSNTLAASYEITRRLYSFVGRQLRVISYGVYLPFLCSYE